MGKEKNNAWLVQCKTAFLFEVNVVQRNKRRGQDIDLVLQQLSADSGIPENILHEWWVEDRHEKECSELIYPFLWSLDRLVEMLEEHESRPDGLRGDIAIWTKPVIRAARRVGDRGAIKTLEDLDNRLVSLPVTQEQEGVSHE